MAQDYDLVIRGGLIVDGSGGTPVEGDVAVAGGKIAAVGTVSGTGQEEIDAKGRIVTPGFIDVHTHYDGQAIWSNRMAPSSAHGVTSVVMGNCGVGFAPCRQDDHALLISVMEGVEDIPGAVMAEGLNWSWESFPGYLDALASHPRDIDVGAYLPHSPLRVFAMGQRGAAREPATEADLALMQRLTVEALGAGALGFATSRQFIHRTADGANIPSYEASAEELRAIARAMRDQGQGTLQIVLDVPHLSWEQEIGLVEELAETSRRPVTFTLATSNEGDDGWRVVLDRIGRRNQAGADITGQVFPRPIGMLIGFDLSINPFVLCPTYRALAGLPIEQKIQELRRPEIRERLLSEKPTDAKSPLTFLGRYFDWMFPVSDPPNYAPPPETSIAAEAKRLGIAPEALAYDRLLAQDGKAMLLVTLGNYPKASLDGLRGMIDHPNTVLGLGDGGAHYGMICDASFPTFFLTHWCRDKVSDPIPLERAIQALSRDPARVVGLADRGLLKPGYKADLNIVDLDRLALRAPEVAFDLPAGGRRLHQRADGFEVTIVSGRITYRNGTPTLALPGTLIRGAQAAPA